MLGSLDRLVHSRFSVPLQWMHKEKMEPSLLLDYKALTQRRNSVSSIQAAPNVVEKR